ncbi:kinase-like domain-containing protein [Gigaspora rosea]|uniref:Kinase-like domain-containing protein n=1 Tax=Gigaspora rosea TaxID=44941 RepID=A0A397VNE2_9GLOM|nr:kinase-like domain-containing protein [Gigaspora rosea]
MIEWIPFDHIDWVVHKAKGGFGSVYTARWIDGPIIDWDDFGQKFIRDGSTIIILKSLDNSSNINENLIKEALAHLNVAKKKTQLTGVNMLYGITKHPYTGNYMLLLEKAECDLREYLQNNDNRLTWKKRYRLLNEISQALDIIHTNGMVHRDFHPGNILLKANNQWTVGDLGFCGPVSDESLRNKCYGVLPYIAPEIIYNGNFECYTSSAEIYSFGGKLLLGLHHLIIIVMIFI